MCRTEPRSTNLFFSSSGFVFDFDVFLECALSFGLFLQDFVSGVFEMGGFYDSCCELLNKNKKSVPGTICVYVCSTQHLVIGIYSFKNKK